MSFTPFGLVPLWFWILCGSLYLDFLKEVLRVESVKRHRIINCFFYSKPQQLVTNYISYRTVSGTEEH